MRSTRKRADTLPSQVYIHLEWRTAYGLGTFKSRPQRCGVKTSTDLPVLVCQRSKGRAWGKASGIQQYGLATGLEYEQIGR